MKKIGIIGSGIVAKTLGKGFLDHGHSVMLGTRDPSKLQAWQEDAGQGGTVGSFAEVAAFGDLIVLAVRGSVAVNALALAGADDLKGKTLIDATNPISDSGPQDGVLSFFTGQNESLMEQLQAKFSEVHFVKAFNSVGSAKMVNPSFDSRPTMFICGNNVAAKDEVKEILDRFGWETEDMGGEKAARAIEPLCMLWCIPGFLHNQWTHAFKLLK